jgi:phosphatidylethanolamine/phosphatidyl-N-methylethanolamine N-methyltransferase
MPHEVQRDLFAAAFSVMRPTGVVVQFTYGPKPPLDKRVREALDLRVERAGWAWRNFPPARVCVYMRAGT